MSSWLFVLTSLLVVGHGRAHVAPGEVRVRVEQRSAGCNHSEGRQHEWLLEGDEFTWGDRRIPRTTMSALRQAIVDARHEVPELLDEVGVTPESLAAHRDEILATAMPDAFRRKSSWASAVLPAEIRRLLAWDRVAPLIRDELLGKWWGSTEKRFVRVTFFTDGHELVVESHELVPWMLPWTVTVDGNSFTSEDLAIPRAVLGLVDPKGPCGDTLDGSDWWPDRFWTDGGFWRRFVGEELDPLLSKEVYTALPGWSRASQRFVVRRVRTGAVDLRPDSMWFELDTLLPAAIDAARWFDFLLDQWPAQTWDDFLALYEKANACAEAQRWLIEWKGLDPTRRIRLDAAGTRGIAELWVEDMVMPAWAHAGFPGEPEFQLLMLEDQRLVGTVYTSSRLRGALIETAHLDRVMDGWRTSLGSQEREQGKIAHHWFDDLAFSYDPRGDAPTYGRVDADGHVEVRTMPRATRLPR
jgi:hypothetical protein